MNQQLARKGKQFVRRFGPINRNIVLVGHMGCGKSTLGRNLAQALKVTFKDADTEIEASADQTIPDMFAVHGEAYFRDGEKRVIKRLLEEEGPMVLATGGGAFMNEETRAVVAQTSVSVWLRPPLEVLVQRTSGKNNRPLLAGKDPHAVFQDLFAKRDPFYQEADIMLRTHNEHPETSVINILARLESYFEVKAP